MTDGTGVHAQRDAYAGQHIEVHHHHHHHDGKPRRPRGRFTRWHLAAVTVGVLAIAAAGVTLAVGPWSGGHPTTAPSTSDSAAAASAARGGPVISVSPSHGSPADMFMVRGTGWLAGGPCHGQVNIWVDGNILSRNPGYPHDDGFFAIQFYPKDSAPGGRLAPGVHTVTAGCDSFESAGVPYTVDG